MKNEIIKYVKGMTDKSYIIEWVEKKLNKLKNINQKEFEHIIDYLISDKSPKRLDRATYTQMKNNTKKWNKTLQKKGKSIKEISKDTQVILDFKNGFKIVKLIGKSAFEREGFLMRHCVSSYYGNEKEIYSLRDKNNNPHCTIEKDMQIKGKGNGCIHPKYIYYVVKFLEHTGMKVRNSEMKNLGYKNFGWLKNKLKNKLFRGKYLYKNEKLIFKNKKYRYIEAIYNYNEYKKCNKYTVIGTLDLRSNKLTEFTQTAEIGTLYLDDNQLTTFTQTAEIGTLDLDNNQLTEFTQTAEIGSLYLDNNQLTEFTQTAEIGTLDLDNNQLTEFTQTAEIGTLDLRSNKLTTFTQTAEIGTLYLDNNVKRIKSRESRCKNDVVVKG